MIPTHIAGKYDYTIYLTDIYGFDPYDGLLQFYHDGSTKKRWIMEVKIRDTHYEELLLEKKKLTELQKKVYDDLTDILYICVTPLQTYVYNLSTMMKQKQLVIHKLECNKATMESRKYEDKVNKVVYLLPTDLAKKIPYQFNEKSYQESKKVVVKENHQHQNNYCLFDYLLKKQPNES